MNHPSSGPSTSLSRGFPLRLARESDSPSLGEPQGPVPAGAGSGVADPTNPLRIDAFTAIAATLDPESRMVFEEAVRTLHALRAGREQIEAKLRETGRVDAIRTVTGTSAIDAAIERTEAILRQLGELRRLHDHVQRL